MQESRRSTVTEQPDDSNKNGDLCPTKKSRLRAADNLFSIMKNSRLYKQLDRFQTSDQAGFRCGYKTTDQFDKNHKTSTIDFRKASDSVERRGVREAIQKQRIEECFDWRIFFGDKVRESGERQQVLAVQRAIATHDGINSRRHGKKMEWGGTIDNHS